MYSLFTEKNSERSVIERLENCSNERFKKVMSSAIRHLHAFIKEVEPSMGEWRKAIDFLTATGQICDDKRQEWILASDTLGASMLIESINHRSVDGATEATVLGPFYVEEAPELSMGESICLDEKGNLGAVNGCVLNTKGDGIENATIDVWQTNDDGFYNVQQMDIQPPMNMRGKFVTGSDGAFHFLTSKPKSYSIPTDGPVGKMLTKMGRHPFRPAHIHFIASAEGFQTLVTHIFVEGDKYLDSDAVFGVKESLVVPFIDQGETWAANFDIVLKTSENKTS